MLIIAFKDEAKRAVIGSRYRAVVSATTVATAGRMKSK